jgi:aspartyl-tRNA(Asn)/glutamyl-tRNA(Gln) amidotransferase subunit A
MTTRPRDLKEAARLVAARRVSPVALTEACLERIDARNGALRAFITVMRDTALAEARRAEQEIGAGHIRGPLHGIPVSVKDLVDVAGVPTTSGSAVPARMPKKDAPLVANLRRAGAVIVGKTNLHEFAFGTTSDETAFGAVHHPLDHARSAGGSSGGAAVAIVEGMCFGSVGTDTGGSIRIPSAACGITGLKPSHGEVPCAAIVPLSTTLDHAGPIARSVADCALLLAAMRDGSVEPLGEPAASTRPLRFGVPEAYFLEVLDPGVRAAFGSVRARLARSGHAIDAVAIANAERTADVYLQISLAEAYWYHAPLLREHAAKYSPGVRLRIELGGYVLAQDYLRAMHAREALRRAVDRALDGRDALLLPGLAIPAPPLGAASVPVGDTMQPVRAVMLRLTQLFNITGHPAIVLPCGNGADGLPRSVQLVGHLGQTERLLQAAETVERQIEGGAGSVGGGEG